MVLTMGRGIIYLSLPYIRVGFLVIYEAKHKDLCHLVEFPKKAQYKVVVFGRGTLLSGFIPELFDSLEPSKVIYFQF